MWCSIWRAVVEDLRIPILWNFENIEIRSSSGEMPMLSKGEWFSCTVEEMRFYWSSEMMVLAKKDWHTSQKIYSTKIRVCCHWQKSNLTSKGCVFYCLIFVFQYDKSKRPHRWKSKGNIVDCLNEISKELRMWLKFTFVGNF